MKQFSTILNLILLAAVGVLFYLHFSGNKKTTVLPVANASQKDSICATSHLIAFVELDSLYDNVEYIKQKQKELESEQDRIAKKYQNDYMQLEAEKNNFLKKGNAITQQEAEDFQGRLYKKQQDIENEKQNQAQALAAQHSRTMEDIQARLKKFLADYNSDNRYSYIFATGTGLDYILYKDSAHNITPDVIKGLTAAFEKKGN